MTATDYVTAIIAFWLTIVSALIAFDQILNIAGYAHVFHFGGAWRGDTALFSIPQSWSD